MENYGGLCNDERLLMTLETKTDVYAAPSGHDLKTVQAQRDKAV